MGGTQGGIEQVTNISPEQEELFSKLIADFDPQALTEMFQTSVGDPARQQFRRQKIPGIQERFQAGGGAGSGALNRAATGAGANLESGLSGQLAQLLAQAQESNLNRQSGLAVAPVTNTFQKMSENPLMDLLSPIATGVGLGAGGPLGAAGVSGIKGLMAGKNK